MSTTEQDRPPFEETFTTLFFQLMKLSGVNADVQNYDTIRQVALRLGSAIKAESRVTALELSKRLQEATLNGFMEFGRTVERLEGTLAELKENLDNVSESERFETFDQTEVKEQTDES